MGCMDHRAQVVGFLEQQNLTLAIGTLNLKYMRLTNRATEGEWIATVSRDTLAKGSMLYGMTFSIDSTFAWARINAFMIDA